MPDAITASETDEPSRIFEAATIVALRAYHVSDSRALSYALVLHALSFFPYVAAGLLILQAHAVSPGRRASL